MRKRLVCLRHPIHVVLALERVALRLERVEDFAGELVAHVLLAAVAGEGHKPPQRERAPAALRHLDGHLIVRAADAAAANLEHRRDRLHSLLQHLDRRPSRALADLLERAVDDLLGDGLLTVQHHAVRELRDELALVHRVGDGGARLDLCATRHYEEPFLAPYLERPCLRSATPEASSAARMTLYR